MQRYTLYTILDGQIEISKYIVNGKSGFGGFLREGGGKDLMMKNERKDDATREL